jgi:glycosyltransferase involved in cell wall biosynthesis
MARRLRVAVPAPLFGAPTTIGRGRMWHEVLIRLNDLVDLRRIDESRGSRLRGRIGPKNDVWLFDGHTGPMAVPEPQVIQLHEAPWNEPESMATLDQSFIDAVVEPTRRAAAVAAAIVCPSESARQQIIDDCAVDPTVVFAAHHGVDHEVFHPGIEGGPDLVARHGGDHGRPYICTVSSVHPRKNLMALRDAVDQLVRDGLPHQLVIVGGPAHGRPDAADLMEATMADLSSTPGRVVSVPFGVSDHELAMLMCGAAAFCLPSLSEGFGLPAAEAMACGAPTVLSDRAALKEVGGGAAIMVDPDPAAIAAGLRQVLQDVEWAQKVGAACHERANEFTWDRCTAEWLHALAAGVKKGADAA